MKKILAEIQSGQFAREWVLENQANRAGFLAMRKRDAEHPIEEVGRPAAEDDVVDQAAAGVSGARRARTGVACASR